MSAPSAVLHMDHRLADTWAPRMRKAGRLYGGFKQNRSTRPNSKLSDADEADGQRGLKVRAELVAPRSNPGYIRAAMTTRSDHTVIKSAEPANTLETPTTPPLRFSAKPAPSADPAP